YKRERIDSDLVGILSKKLNEEKSIVENLTPCSAERQEAPLLERNGFVFYERELPDEVMLEVFRRLSLPDIAQASGVCRGWYALSEESQLWKAVRLHIHGDYPENQATRENAKLHWLRVHVNTLSDLDKIAYLVTKYQLNNGDPFVKYKKLDTLDILLNTDENIDERAAKGDKRALEMKIDGLIGSSKHPQFNVADLIDRLAEQGDESAIGWRLEGLANGWYGYQKDPKAVDELINHLAEEGLDIYLMQDT
ncbi:hypothetical protein GR268_41625, partial [Rhizobium leguminosarum]|nr:hypothetical protein [Rhizobium leguminosarum]